MAKRKRTNDDLENTTWKTKDRATVNQGHGGYRKTFKVMTFNLKNIEIYNWLRKTFAISDT
jgi:hypothetical protein